MQLLVCTLRWKPANVFDGWHEADAAANVDCRSVQQTMDGAVEACLRAIVRISLWFSV